MLTSLQIILLVLAGIFAIGAVLFLCLYLSEGKQKTLVAEVKTVYTNEPKQEENSNSEKVEVMSVNEMLKKLNQLTENEKTEETVQEKTEETVVETTETVETQTTITTTEVVEQLETAEEPETVQEEVEEVQEETAQDVSNNVEPQIIERVEVKTLDYKERLEKITQTRDKISRDLEKLQNAILKYERTKRRKERNQKMLDRRAGELANLNLVMYSVTDIKNVDEDKKVKQEELTAHIAELKASIQDADEYIESNKEKNSHDVSMAKFLISEKARYNDEIAEIEKLMKETEDVVA